MTSPFNIDDWEGTGRTYVPGCGESEYTESEFDPKGTFRTIGMSGHGLSSSQKRKPGTIGNGRINMRQSQSACSVPIPLNFLKMPFCTAKRHMDLTF